MLSRRTNIRFPAEIVAEQHAPKTQAQPIVYRRQFDRKPRAKKVLTPEEIRLHHIVKDMWTAGYQAKIIAKQLGVPAKKVHNSISRQKLWSAGGPRRGLWHSKSRSCRDASCETNADNAAI